MVIYVDFDETIARTSVDRDYVSSEPILENIDMINTLYDKGHTIIYWTARGTLKKDNYFKITLNQSVGIGEHSDIIDAIEKELDSMASYEDKLQVLNKYFGSTEFNTKELLKD